MIYSDFKNIFYSLLSLSILMTSCSSDSSYNSILEGESSLEAMAGNQNIGSANTPTDRSSTTMNELGNRIENGSGTASSDTQAQDANRWIRIYTSYSPSEIAWAEIEIIGAPTDHPMDNENLAINTYTSAFSHISSQSPNFAVDGQLNSIWNAGVSTHSWIQIDLGRPCFIEQVRLAIAHTLAGDSMHEVQMGKTQDDLKVVHVFSQYTQNQDWLTYTVDYSSSTMQAGTMQQAGIENSDMGGSISAGMTAGDMMNLVEPTVDQWRRIILSFTHDDYRDNPFMLELQATFTHQNTGQELIIPAYYDGDQTWRIAFMPTHPGLWSWYTQSTEEVLNGQSGQLTAIASNHRGLLTADPNAPNKWRYLNGPPVVPISLFVNAMLDDADTDSFERLVQFLATHHFSLLNFRISENDKAFADVSALTLDLSLWRRLEARLELLTDYGMGVDLMLYTDDSGRPSYPGQSVAEQLLIRYMIARLSSFPSVIFNTGIDLIEYRDQAWVNWYGTYVRMLDPYKHPISSRYGGGSGQLVMSGQTFNSIGARNSQMSNLLAAYQRSDQIPALNNDNWSEDLNGINGHTPADLRRAGWKAVMAGGVGFSIRHNQLYCPRGITECDRYFPIDQAIELLDCEQWISPIFTFIRDQLGEIYQRMHPAPTLVDATGGKFALADDARTHILYLTIGVGDTWDTGNGDVMTLNLNGVLGDFIALWLNPRTGMLNDAGRISGGGERQMIPPDTQDWILWLHR